MNNFLKKTFKLLLITMLIVPANLSQFAGLKVEAAFDTNKQWTFNFTGSVQNFSIDSIDKSGKYKIEAYGAQGQNGGLGGKAEAVFDLYPGDKLNIYVGGQNGYNGGGSGSDSGGGATDVRLNSTSINDRLLAGAGGGGGSGGTAGGNGNGAGGTSVGAGAGGNGSNGGGGGRSYNYTYETGYNEETGYWQETGYWKEEKIWGNIPCGPNDEPGINCGWGIIGIDKTWVSTGQKWVSTGYHWVSTGYQTIQGNAGQGGSNFFSDKALNSVSLSGVQNGNGKVIITAIEPHNRLPQIQITTSDQQVISHNEGYNHLLLKGKAYDEDPEDTIALNFSIIGVAGFQGIPLDIDKNGNYEHLIEIPPSLRDGTYTINVHAIDSKQGESTKSISFHLDNTIPTITFENIQEGDTKYGEILPSVKVAGGRTNVTTTVKLNGDTYNGAVLKKGGEYKLEVTAIDEVGNKNTKVVQFTLNESPAAIKNFDNQSLNKFQEVTFNLMEYFSDFEGDQLKVNYTNSNEETISTKLEEYNFSITAKKQGTSQIDIKVNDGHTDSETLTFLVSVNTRVPEINILTNEWILLDDSSDISISGTVKDLDIEKVTITGTINGTNQVKTIEKTTGDDDSWSLVWNSSVISQGVFSDSVTVKAEDDYGGVSEQSFNKPIVKVSGAKENYIPVIALYEKDIEQKANDWVAATHAVLLNAYEAMKVLEESNNPTTQADAETKVASLQEGDLKDFYQKRIKELTLDWLQDNIENSTADELERAGIKDVVDNRLPDYQEGLKDYEKSPLSQEDIQKVVDAINAVLDAAASPSTESIHIAYEKVELLDESPLKDRLLQDLEAISVDYIESNPDTTKIEDLNHANIGNVIDRYESEYQNRLEDILPSLAPNATKEDIQKVIDFVNKVMEAYERFIKTPNGKNLLQYILIVDSLPEGKFKDSHKSQIPDLTVIHIRYAPAEQDEDTYTWGQFTFSKKNLELYNKHLPQYIEDLKPSLLIHSDVQAFVSAIDSFELAVSSPIATNIRQAMTDINNLKNGKFKNELLGKISKDILESINNDLENVTSEDLTAIGIENAIQENEEAYQEALKEYQEDVGGSLNLEDIQDVIDAVNSIIKAEQSPTRENIQAAKDAINNLKDGQLKDELLDRLIDVIIEFIENNLDDLLITDLELLDITDVQEELLPHYIEYLKEYLPLSVEKIQQVIDLTNQLNLSLKEVTNAENDSLSKLVEKLDESELKSKFEAITLSLPLFIAYESDKTNETFNSLESQVETIQLQIKSYVDTMVESIRMAITTEATTEAVEQSVTQINKLKEGSFKTRLLAKAGSVFLEYVQKNPEKITLEDLIRAGFERVKEEYIDLYIEGLISLTEETGTLSRETIQLVIDVVNGLEDTMSLEDAKKLKLEMEKLPDSNWKKEKLKEADSLISKLTPRPPSGGSGSSPSQPDDKENEKENDGESKTPEVPQPSESEVVEGTQQGNQTDFNVDNEIIESVVDGNKDLVLIQDDTVEIIIPAGSIDFSSLQQSFGKFGLLIQLIKLDDKNYRLKVTAVTPEGEKEIVNFQKHLSVLMKESSIVNQLRALYKAREKLNDPSLIKSVVLRKDGENLVSVPHIFDGKNFTIKTTRTGHFVVLDDFKTFEDIQDLWNREEVEELALRRITTGTTPTTFSPNKNITRAQLAVMIARAMELQPKGETSFSDVKGQWYEKEVQALYEAGIIEGTSPTTFEPGKNVTRQQAASMMTRALQYGSKSLPKADNLPYADANEVGSWAKSDVSILNQLNIMTGKSDNLFDPYNYLTRAQMAKILNRTLKEIGFM